VFDFTSPITYHRSVMATDDKTLIVYHRCGGKSLGYPPNTLFTAKWALKFGAKAVEYDVVLCKDGMANKIIMIEPKLLKDYNLDITLIGMIYKK
jgi:hypothetical protein